MDYSLCDQTVTLYRPDGTVRVVDSCLLVYTDALENSQRFLRKFLLVQPGQAAIYPGDKVLPGVGRPAEYAALLPETTPGLCVVREATPYYLGGKICHWEARG